MSNESVKPVRIAFDCAKCFKSLQLEERIYKKAYEGHTLCLSCRPAEKAVQILTEDEIHKIDVFRNQKAGVSWEVVSEIIDSHRALYAANAELSFKNMNAKAKVKEYYRGLKENVGRSGLTENDVYHATQAIENVLHAFKIKIEGVNA